MAVIKCATKICVTITCLVIIVLILRTVYHEFGLGYNDLKGTLCGISGPLKYDDEKVIEILRQAYMKEPSIKPYNLSNDEIYKAKKISYSWPYVFENLKLIFENQTKGFFVEAGALDGEFLSNTLWLEMYNEWTGLLVESDPNNYKELLKKNRHSWTSNTCLSSEPYPKQAVMISRQPDAPFDKNSWILRGASQELAFNFKGTLYHRLFKYATETYASVQCFPLASYLLALNRTEIDLITLDLQGSEEKVLQTIPFDIFNIRVFVVENETLNITINEKLNTFFKERGYVLLACGGGEPDYIFMKNNDPFLDKFSIEKPTHCNSLMKLTLKIK